MYLSFAIKESQVCRQQQRQWWRFQNSKMQYEPVIIIRWKVKDFVILVLNPTNRKSNTNSMALNVINWDIYEVQLHTCDGWWCYFYFFCFLIDFSCSLFFCKRSGADSVLLLIFAWCDILCRNAGFSFAWFIIYGSANPIWYWTFIKYQHIWSLQMEIGRD